MSRFPLFKVFTDVEGCLANVRDVLECGFINEGEWVTKFQRELENFFETDQVVLTNSCTSAISLALHLCQVQHQTVLSTPMTCVASNTPIVNAGAHVTWVDIDPKTAMINKQTVLNAAYDARRNIRPIGALIGVNWAGTPMPVADIDLECKRQGIPFIQDAAHSFGAKFDGKDISNFADFTCYSFQAIKHLTTGDGGCLVVRDRQVWERAKKLKWFGIDREVTKDAKGEWKGQRWEVDVPEAGFKYNMNNIDAAIGMANVKHISNVLETHRKNAQVYSRIFSNSSLITPLTVPEGVLSSFWVYTATVSESTNRDKLLEKLNAAGVDAGLVHIPNDGYSCFADSRCNLPGVRQFEATQISLPCGWWMSEADVEHVANLALELCRSA